MFDTLIGNDNVKQRLTRMVESGTVGQSLLFAGPEGIGKSLFAEQLGKHLLKSAGSSKFSDLNIYRPEGKIGMHSIESMRRFSEEVYLSPMEGSKKVFIIHEADRMLPYSANALLKTFEEPALDTVIILLSSRPDKLLPTIRSRCRTVLFTPISKEAITAFLIEKGVEPSEADKRAHLSAGSLGRALAETNPLRSQILDILSGPKWQTWNELSQSAQAISKEIEEEQKALRDAIPEENPEMTASQKQAIEKEIEGTLAMRLFSYASEIFTVTLGWFRDLELIHSGGCRQHLIHIDREKELAASHERGERLPLEAVTKAIREAQTALERSTPFTNILETLFLKLERL